MSVAKFIRSRAVLLSCVALVMAAQVNGHGYMTFPPTRNMNEHTPQGANGHGVCGGFAGDWDQSGASEYVDSTIKSPITILRSGEKFVVKMRITQAHKGHAVLEICRPAPGQTKLTQECFQRLPRDNSDTDYAPFDPKHPDHFIFPMDDCTRGNDRITGTWVIPADFGNCEHCVLRWYWQTGNSCVASDSQVAGNLSPEMSAWRSVEGCGVDSSNGGMGFCSQGADCPHPSCRFESFKACADVKIVGGSSPPVVTTVAPTRPPITPALTTKPSTPKPTTPKPTFAPTTLPTQASTITSSANECAAEGGDHVPCNGASDKCKRIFGEADCAVFCCSCCNLDRTYGFGYCN